MKLLLDRLDENVNWYDGQLIKDIQNLGRQIGAEEDKVTLVLVDGPYIRKLNKEFRNVDRETDVISFSFLGDRYPVDDNITGEVYISCDTLEKEANTRDLDVRKLILRTVLHGLLHVYGYDHQLDDEAETMEDEERRLLQNVLEESDIKALFA